MKQELLFRKRNNNIKVCIRIFLGIIQCIGSNIKLKRNVVLQPVDYSHHIDKKKLEERIPKICGFNKEWQWRKSRTKFSTSLTIKVMKLFLLTRPHYAQTMTISNKEEMWRIACQLFIQPPEIRRSWRQAANWGWTCYSSPCELALDNRITVLVTESTEIMTSSFLNFCGAVHLTSWAAERWGRVFRVYLRMPSVAHTI